MILWIVSCFLITASVLASDPLPEMCLYSGYSEIVCSNFYREDDLVRSIRNLVHQFRIHRKLVLREMDLNFIRSDTFKGDYYIDSLEIINSTLGAVTDRGLAFSGLGGRLLFLEFEGCTVFNELDWSVFNNLTRLMEFQISNCRLGGIDGIASFKSSAVDTIAIVNSAISELPAEAFAGLQNLLSLNIENNHIRHLNRGMLPNPAARLMELNIRYNRLEVLPKDMFANMTSLSNLLISGNKLLILEENTFPPVWTKLRVFEALDIDLTCDCRLSWILKENQFPKRTMAKCKNPDILRDRDIVTLEEMDLYC